MRPFLGLPLAQKKSNVLCSISSRNSLASFGVSVCSNSFGGGAGRNEAQAVKQAQAIKHKIAAKGPTRTARGSLIVLLHGGRRAMPGDELRMHRHRVRA